MKKTDQQVKASIQDEDDYDQVQLETDPDRYDIDTESVAGLGEEIVNAREARRRRSCCETCFLTRLFRTYDTQFLIALIFQYFNTGAKTMVALAMLDIFKNEYKLEPDYE